MSLTHRPTPMLQEDTKPDSDSNDLEEVAVTQSSLQQSTIKSVKEANAWIALPAAKKTTTVSIVMCLFSTKKFERGWFLSLIDYKRAAAFPKAKALLDGLPFSIRKKYLLSLRLFVVPFKEKAPDTIPDVTFREAAILHCHHVTGLSTNASSGIPTGNVSKMERILEEPFNVPNNRLLKEAGHTPMALNDLQLLDSRNTNPTDAVGTTSTRLRGELLLDVAHPVDTDDVSAAQVTAAVPDSCPLEKRKQEDTNKSASSKTARK